MTGYRLSFNDQLRCLALAVVYVTYIEISDLRIQVIQISDFEVI